MDTLVLALVSIAVGLVVGLLSGLLGIGGGTILVPTFKLGYLMDSIACTATSLFTIIPTSISGAISHLRNKTCIPALGIAAGLGGALTSSLGVWAASRSEGWMIMVGATAIITYSACTMLRKALKLPVSEKGAFRANVRAARERRAQERASAAVAREGGGDASPAPLRAASAPVSTAEAAFDPAAAALSAEPVADDFPTTPRQIVAGVLIGLVAGLASGYVGVGGGFLMVPLMIQFIHTPMKLTSGTSLIAVMILAVPGVVYQAVLGNVNWVVGIAVAAGSIPGAAIGARLTSWVPERTLRFAFGGLLLVAAVSLVANQMGLLG